MVLPTIEIDWEEFKAFDEIYLDDLTHFGVLVLTLVKGDEVQLVAYDIDEQKWGLLQE
jgi:hypothetical protein